MLSLFVATWDDNARPYLYPLPVIIPTRVCCRVVVAKFPFDCDSGRQGGSRCYNDMAGWNDWGSGAGGKLD